MRTREGGQSLVELALVLVPLVLLLLGAIQFGVIWATQVAVTNAVRDSVRAASLVQPKADLAGTVTFASETSYATTIRSNVLMPALQANVPYYVAANVVTSRVCYTSVTDVLNATSLQATVTVAYAHPVFIPFIAGVLGTNALTANVSLSVPVGLEKPFVLPPTTDPAGCAS